MVRHEAANSRSGAPAQERTAEEAPASTEHPGGRSLSCSVFRGRSLGTRTSSADLFFLTLNCSQQRPPADAERAASRVLM